MRYPVKSIISAALFGAGLMLSAAPASALTVDGDLSDWGITVGDNNTSNFSSLNPGIGIVSSYTEDQEDNSNNHYLGPNYGGQNYDAVFIGMAMQGSIMYLAIVTGQRPDNGLSTYSPGDIYMTTPLGIVGIEVGGGPGGGAGGAIAEGAEGSTYNVNSSGYTQSYGTTATAQTAGSVWANATWINDPIAPATPVQMSINGASTQVGTADYVYTRNSQTSHHSVIELALDITNLLDEDGEGLIGIHWSPSCGNDIVQAFFLAAVPTTETISEPGTSLVWLIGLGAIAAMRKRSRKRR